MDSSQISRQIATMVFLHLLLTQGPSRTDANLSFGLREAWRGFQHQLSEQPKEPLPHIKVYYPTGEVKQFFWSSVRPLLWGYVCRMCAHFPDRCVGDTYYCRVSWRSRKNRHESSRR